MKLVYQYMAIFLSFSPTSNHLHPLQVENCDSNSRLVVDEDDNVKSGLKGFINKKKYSDICIFTYIETTKLTTFVGNYPFTESKTHMLSLSDHFISEQDNFFFKVATYFILFWKNVIADQNMYFFDL